MTAKPSSLAPGALAKKNVELLPGYPTVLHLRCLTCGATWSPILQTGGHLPRGFADCPNGCKVEGAKP